MVSYRHHGELALLASVEMPEWSKVTTLEALGLQLSRESCCKEYTKHS